MANVNLDYLNSKVKVDSEHPEYTKVKDKWQVVRDAETSNYESYVIPPEYTNRKSNNNRVVQRNKNYIARAIFVNYVFGTMGALTGLATSADPVLDLSDSLKYLEFDCTEDRLNIYQLNRKAIREIGGYGRFIMLTDFPSTPEGLSEEQINRLDPKPRIRYYSASDMLNWDFQYINGVYQQTFAVFREEIRIRLADFTWNTEYQYRVCELDLYGHYMVTIRDKNGNLVAGPIWPKFNGKPVDYLPIDIVGAEDNNEEVDEPPMYPIAHVNFGHLRNSATYEDNLDAHGQGTTFITTDARPEQFKQYNAGRDIVMGSREAYVIGGPGSDVKLLQLQANQEVANAMTQKQEQMLAMGAHMITTQSANAPVETTQLNMGSKIAPLINWVKNYNQALNNQIRNCARFLNLPDNSGKISLPTDFIPKTGDAAVLQALLSQQMGGIISKKILRDYDRQIGVIPSSVSDEDIDAEIAEENPLGVSPNNPDPFSENSSEDDLNV